jgi:hypothetical protein
MPRDIYMKGGCLVAYKRQLFCLLPRKILKVKIKMQQATYNSKNIGGSTPSYDLTVKITFM